MYYLGFLAHSVKDVVIFKSIKRPKKGDFRYFVKVIGPYYNEAQARGTLSALQYQHGYHENPGHGLKGTCKCGYSKNPIDRAKAIKLTKKVIAFAKDVYGTYKENPGKEYHDRKFLMYLKDLEKYQIGSVPYIATLAKAYEHLESAKDSIAESVR